MFINCSTQNKLKCIAKIVLKNKQTGIANILRRQNQSPLELEIIVLMTWSVVSGLYIDIPIKPFKSKLYTQKSQDFRTETLVEGS